MQSLDDRAETDEQFLHALLLGQLILDHFHLVERKFTGTDLL